MSVSEPLPAGARAPARGPGVMSPALAALALASLMGLQPVSTDLWLPALPILTRALAAPMRQVQLTMSALILAFGLGQMVWGPIADRIGRRPVLLCGLALYTAASAGCLFASRIDSLVAWRVMQGAALAAAVVCARAIVRDLYEPLEGTRVMALALSGLGVIAITAPVLGGVSAAAWGWRGPVAVVALIGAASLVFVAWRLPETLPRQIQKAGSRGGPGELLATWWRIARHPVFVAWSSLVACTYGGLFTVLAASSFAYMDVLGLSAAAYGALMAVGSLSYLAGTLVCRRWVRRHGPVGAVQRGAGFSLAGGVLMVGLVAAGIQSVWTVLLPHMLFGFGHGVHQPCGQAGVVSPFPQAAGAASALAGLVLALVAFGVGRWLGVALDGTLRPMAWTLGLWSVLTSALAWGLVPRKA